MTNEEKARNCIQMLIDESIWIKDTFGDNFLKVGEFYSITKNFRDYYHDGIYRLDFDIINGLYFSIVGLKLTNDEKLGPSQWILHTTISLSSFWKGCKKIVSDFNECIEYTDVDVMSKNQIFDSNVEYSWGFVIRALSDIKKHGIEVPDNLYPTEQNEDYDSVKTIEFIKNNLFKINEKDK